MPISKKEINKEMMFNKIMPSGFASKKIGEANAIKDSIQEAEKAEEQELKNLGKARNKKTDEPTLHADIKPSEKAVPDKPLTIAEEEKPKEDDSEPLVLNGDTAEDIKKQEKKASKSRSKKKNDEKNEEPKPETKEDATEAEEAAEEAAEETAQPENEETEAFDETKNADESEKTFNTADRSEPLTLEKKPEEEKVEENEEPKAEAKPASNQPVMVNIYEKMVLDKVDAAIAKFKCCSCYLCHQDIVTMALNNLKPKYIVAVEDDLPNLLQKENASEVTSAIMKAILHVKANPRH